MNKFQTEMKKQHIWYRPVFLHQFEHKNVSGSHVRVFIKRVSLHGLIPRSDWPLEEVGGFPGVRYLSHKFFSENLYIFGKSWSSFLCLMNRKRFSNVEVSSNQRSLQQIRSLQHIHPQSIHRACFSD